jgi:hypothetical protein
VLDRELSASRWTGYGENKAVVNGSSTDLTDLAIKGRVVADSGQLARHLHGLI